MAKTRTLLKIPSGSLPTQPYYQAQSKRSADVVESIGKVHTWLATQYSFFVGKQCKVKLLDAVKSVADQIPGLCHQSVVSAVSLDQRLKIISQFREGNGLKVVASSVKGVRLAGSCG
jgi:hypothetical protein